MAIFIMGIYTGQPVVGELERLSSTHTPNRSNMCTFQHGAMICRPHDTQAMPLLNKWNQLHSCKNVYVTDGACMTSTSTQNPSLTYMAITARACNHAIKESKKG